MSKRPREVFPELNEDSDEESSSTDETSTDAEEEFEEEEEERTNVSSKVDDNYPLHMAARKGNVATMVELVSIFGTYRCAGRGGDDPTA